MIKIGVLASHRGSNLQAVIDGCEKGIIDAQVVAAISNNSAAFALERAAKAGIATYHLSSKNHTDDSELDQAICDVLNLHQVNLVLTLGYMKKLGNILLNQFESRILNIHPALLPRHGGMGMYGDRVHQAVLDAGETESGASIHLVDLEYDTGSVIAQSKIKVLKNDNVDTLSGRVLELEHSLLVDTLAKISHGEVCLPGCRPYT